MSSADSSLVAEIIYYSQEQYFNQLEQATTRGLEKFNSDPALLFFKAYGLLRQGHFGDAISDLENIQSHPNLSLCSVMALLYAHRSYNTSDREAIQELESSLKELRQSAGHTAFYYASLFLWLIGRQEKAREYIDHMLKAFGHNDREDLVLKGWVDLTSDKPHIVKKSIKYLDQGTQDTKDVLGLMGKATYLMMHQNFSGALEMVNQITVASGGFLPALTLKMRLFLARHDWEQTIETAHRILEKDENNIDACQILAVHELAREGNTIIVSCRDVQKFTLKTQATEAANFVGNLIRALETKEPGNPSLHLKKILVVSRLCGRHQEVVQLVSSFLEQISTAMPSCGLAATELGYLYLLQNQPKEARAWYTQATKLEENRMSVLTGNIWCHILQGQLEEATQQLEFLKEVQQSLGKSEVLVFLQALLASKKHQGEQEAPALLKEAVELHFSAMHSLPLGPEYFERLDPSFLVCVARQFLRFCPKQPRAPGQVLSPLLKQVAMILSPVLKAAPAMMDPLFVMAEVKFLSDLENAQHTLQRCLDLDPTLAETHLLMAQIYLAQDNFTMCAHCLELGVSHNFQVRNYPLYHFIKARALNKSGDHPEAIKTLKMIMKMPVMKGEEGGRRPRTPSLQPSERASVLLELVDALRLNGELHEATKVMQDAIHQFSGTPEESRVTIANVDLALSKGSVDVALDMLRRVAPAQPGYIQAKEKMAAIYLRAHKDARLYIGCYRELCEHLPGPHTSLLLGDAYMNIQEPEKALEVYEEAYKKNPHDASLVSRIGQAYVKTHQYSKAINYYEAAQKISGQDFLCCDLAELLLKLKKFNKAEKVLKQALDRDSAKDIASLMNQVKCLLLLAKVYKSHRKEEVVETLNKALDLQLRILKRVPMEQPEAIPPQKQLASSICVQCAEYYAAEKDYAKAVRSYKDALSYAPTNNKVVLELARLHLLQGHLDLCEDQCAMLLQTCQEDASTSVILADLMFQKQNYEAAISHYRQVLEKVPDNFLVLNKLIDLLRRSGRLEEAPTFFELAKKASGRVLSEPGFNYCRGIYYWHIGQPNEALKFLNKARKDSTWGQMATYNMVQICLNPDNEIVGGEAFENPGAENNSWGRTESRQHGVRTAEKLLQEFSWPLDPAPAQLQLLQSLCLLATREKTNMELALGVFVNMVQAEKDNVAGLLAMAQAYTLLKQIPKARTQLKRLAKAPWALPEADELEQGWLLLADLYCQSGKFDLASELLRRCLQYNKSCSKAYEYMGFIMEKEQSYKDAATNYELAWKYSHHANPAVGFKLAFNYLKDKKFVEAIEICHCVLREHPNYPKIREEILEKAQGSLRP
ncbi:tetratricopeptide repeat protein 21A isoform X2 [Perognathus longimembris pacificus]|uniref:tetratricopeptide repeat protein 21A isoform X2 n=1 Tax=Perognathus longimembris pacificus TaxID=214514 RepID=UPI00201968DA|nr:tetratricopeptide repeat protein 21A isoform X2 [Perognathus longimembris pacificus]